MATKRVCIIGGGVAGVGLWWTLSQPNQPGVEWDVTIIHDADRFGGHALTVPVPRNGATIQVDTGVQFFIPTFYPNIQTLVGLPGIQPKVPVVDYSQLKVACGFPRRNGAPQNWGNFPAYRGGQNFAMYTDAMFRNAQRFQDFMDLAVVEIVKWGPKTLTEYFDGLAIKYEDQDAFLNYFIYPYLSIINGYGKALADTVTFEDLVPLFANLPPKWPGLGSFTMPGSGYRRFVNGASSLVQALADQASQNKPAAVMLNSKVVKIAAASTLPGPVKVTWMSVPPVPGSGPVTNPPVKGPVMTGEFDKVVITTDILTAAALLNNEDNLPLWNGLYSKYLAAAEWPLHPGKCYIHTDQTMLSPDLREQQETLQFTAYYAPQKAAPYYDMFYTYTTYLQENIHTTEPAAKGLYLTMYGYVPDQAKGDKVPADGSVIFEEVWSHGMWLPSFMLPAKRNLHLAQGLGVDRRYPGQLDTSIYFAGNNTTADSLEHAFISGEVIANYAFGAPFPLSSMLAWGMYELFYTEFMFPLTSVAAKLALLGHGLLRAL